MAESTEQLNRKGNRRGMHRHPNSMKNLEKRNLKGNSNAKKDYSITRIIKEMLDDPAEERWLEVEDKGKDLTWRILKLRCNTLNPLWRKIRILRWLMPVLASSGFGPI